MKRTFQPNRRHRRRTHGVSDAYEYQEWAQNIEAPPGKGPEEARSIINVTNTRLSASRGRDSQTQ